jgi:hypothetical protein
MVDNQLELVCRIDSDMITCTFSSFGNEAHCTSVVDPMSRATELHHHEISAFFIRLHFCIEGSFGEWFVVSLAAIQFVW